jgi:predicted ATPase/DNA-binding SARP family transcriptional activator
MLHLKLLGPPEASRGGKPLGFRSRREQGLLFYLAAEGGMHSREKLGELLWPESQEGRAALRNTLSGLRRTLRGDDEGPEGGAYIATGRGQTVGFDPSPGVELDLRILEAASGPVPLGDTGDKRRAAFDALKAAAEAYRGEFLEGFSLDDAPDFEYWAGVERERWRRRAEAVFDRLSGLQLETGEVEGAIVTAERWAEHAPLSEAAYRRLMEVRFAAGDKTGALRAYEASRQALKESLGIEPEPETEALAVRIRAEASPRLPRRQTAAAQGAIETPLVGRSEEFGTLVREYHVAREGGARAVLVAGEAGIGKTRLVSDFLAWARAEGADVLKGAAFEASGRLPYGPVVDALRERLDRERAPDDLLGDVWLSELSRILPEIRERYPDLPPPTAGETSAKTRLFEAASSLIAAFAERSETVVFFVDDLQWADAATLDFLHYAARRWAEDASPLLLVANLRAEAFERDPRLAGWWTGISRDLPAVRFTLGALSGEDTGRLLGTLVDTAGEDGRAARLERLGRWLHAETGGQPFFLTQTLCALVERGVLVPDPTEGGPALEVAAFEEEALRNLLPARVHDMIRARIANLGSAATELLSAGAVLGRGFDFDRACRVAGFAEGDCLQALDELLASGLLCEVEGDLDAQGLGEATYAIAHDRMRDVAYTEVGSARRRLFHRRALGILTEEGAPAADLARHALAAGLSNEAFRHLLAAGDEAMALFAASDAVEHYERARRLHREGMHRPDGSPFAQETEHLYANLGRAYELSGEWEEARATYEAMLTASRKEREPALECAALNRLAIFLVQRFSDVGGARGVLREALKVARAGGEKAAVAETEWNLAQMAIYRWEPDAAVAHAEMALEHARELGLEELVARSLYTLGISYNFAARWEECVALAREAAGLYAQMGNRGAGPLAAQYLLVGSPPSAALHNRAMEAHSLSTVAVGEVNRGEPGASVNAGRAALKVGREINNDWSQALASTNLAHGLTEEGRYGEALRTAQEGVRIARRLPSPGLPLLALYSLGNAYQAVLELENAQTTYQEALEIADTVARPWRSLMVTRLCANRALAGDREAAHRYALESVRIRNAAPSRLVWLDFARYHETEALLWGGNEELAREDVRRLGERVGGDRRFRVVHLRMLAVLHGWDGQSTEALVRLNEAKVLAEEIDLPGELWQIWAALGEHREQRGEPEEAHDAFSRAARIVETLAGEVEDEVLREGFLSAPQPRRVLEQG